MKYYPIGTVVVLKNGTWPFMSYERQQITKKSCYIIRLCWMPFIYKVSLIKIILPFFSIMILIRFYIKGWLRQPKQIWKNCYIFPK